MPILAEDGGTVRFEDIDEGETLRKEKDASTGAERLGDHGAQGRPAPADRHRGRPRATSSKAYYIPGAGPPAKCATAQKVTAGTLLAKTPREVSRHAGHHRRSAARHRDLRGPPAARPGRHGRDRRQRPPRRQEARQAHHLDPARRRRRQADRRGDASTWCPHGKHLRVHTGDYVKEGDPLVDGPLVPHDILRISGIEAVQNYLVREVQAVYRSQRVDIDDKHIEIIVSQMLRKVKVETMGDTGLLPGSVIDKFAFREVNDRLMSECVKIKDPGDSHVRGRQDRQPRRRSRKSAPRSKPTASKPPTLRRADAGHLRDAAAGHHQGGRAVGELHLGAASFQETTKVLTEAALAGKVDYLVGLKENVILGHLIPAGTGFQTHQEAEVRINAPQSTAEASEPRGRGRPPEAGWRRREAAVGISTAPRSSRARRRRR